MLAWLEIGRLILGSGEFLGLSINSLGFQSIQWLG